MRNRVNFKQKGFTIIEVALVLAIAALIFLVVFLAVPALQRNQRDDARKRDITTIVQAVTTMTANTGSEVPAGTADKVYTGGSPVKGNKNLGDYLDKLSNNIDFIDVIAIPAGSASSDITTKYMPGDKAVKNVSTAASVPGLNEIVVFTNAQCGDESGNNKNAAISTASKRASAVVVQIENGGVGKYYCENAS
jgi:prepilin-type N-terminal cleavage/methylation domain-containing protein